MSDRTPTQETLRRSRDALVAAVSATGVQFRGNACRCPWHDDRAPSAGVYRHRDDGVWLFKCLGCGIVADVFDVRARVSGKSLADVLTEARDGDDRPRQVAAELYPSPEMLAASYGLPLEAEFQYVNPDTGLPDLVVLRMRTEKGKTFRQCHFNGDGWVKAAPPGPLPLYNRTRVRAADTVIVVEGEKCVHAVADAGHVATTAPGGAGKARMADWRPLAGKTAVLWPDNDPKGIEHMKDVQGILEQLNPPARVLWLDPEELGLDAKQDAADYLAPCASPDDARAALESVIALATPTGGADELWDMLKDTVEGKRRSLPMPWPHLTAMSRALSPGTVTCVCGDPSCGKSFFTIELAWKLHQLGERVAILELEDDKAFHLNRALAQVDDRADWTNPEWVERHPGELVTVRARHGEFMDAFAPCVTAMPDEEPTYAWLLDWLKARCEAGTKVVVIDPITAASSNGKPWVEDRQFVMSAKVIVRKHGARLVIVTHPKVSTKPGSALHSIAGGAAFPRFCHTVLWLHTLEEPRSYTVSSPYGNYPVSANRTIRISKARNGPGTGMHLAFSFEGSSLRFTEHGPIVRDGRDPGDVKAAIGVSSSRLNKGPGVPSMQQDPFAD
jgi:KaiC/GvpD/RAD55 family RecA-like ATPase